jgi:hypothetical protein
LSLLQSYQGWVATTINKGSFKGILRSKIWPARDVSVESSALEVDGSVTESSRPGRRVISIILQELQEAQAAAAAAPLHSSSSVQVLKEAASVPVRTVA